MKTLVIKIFLLLLLPAMTINAQDVEVTITGIRNTKGQMGIGVFRDNESFKKEQAFRELQFAEKRCQRRRDESPVRPPSRHVRYRPC